MKYPEIKAIVKELRMSMTPSEKQLWKELRNRKSGGLKFRRQHPIFYESSKNEHFFFVADFYCARKGLVIELDGKIHEYQKDRDHNRDMILKEKGLRTLRIKNEELENIDIVLKKILQAVEEMTDSPPLHTVERGPGGEEK